MSNLDELYDLPTTIQSPGAENIFATNELPVDMHKKKFTAYPSLTPLTVILSKMEDMKAFNYRIDWEEENDIPTEVVVTAALAASGTALTIGGGGMTCVLDTLLFNPRTMDIARVSVAPTSDTSLTVVRSSAGTTQAAWVLNDVLHVLPPCAPENESDVYRVSSVADSNVYNLMQLVRLQYSITRIGAKMKTHWGVTKRDQLKAQKFKEVMVKSEKLKYFGGRSTGGTAPATKRTMGGLVHYLKNGTLYKDFNGILTESGFRRWMGDFKDLNPEAVNVKLFASGNVIDIITNFGADKVRLSPESKTYGLDISTYRSRGLMVGLVPLPLLTDAQTRGWAFLLDMDKIMQKTLDPLFFYPEAKNVGQSELIYDTYREVTSMLLAGERNHAMGVNMLL